MAYIDDAEITSTEVESLSDRDTFIATMKILFWEQFEKHRHKIPRFLGIFPFAGQLEKWLEKFMGPNTAK
jgi:hypothetical protein